MMEELPALSNEPVRDMIQRLKELGADSLDLDTAGSLLWALREGRIGVVRIVDGVYMFQVRE